VAIFVMSGLAAFACSQPEPSSSSPASSGSAASGSASSAPKVEADKPFAPGGRITLTLAAGGYDVRASSDGHIRVTLDRDIGDTKVDVTVTDDHAEVVVKDTPQRNFHATIEVPKNSDLVTRLTAGELILAAITGNKDIENLAGDVRVTVSDPSEYGEVDAQLKAGDIDASAFGGSKSGLFPHFTWSGPGKFKLRVSQGAGNLVLRKG
jgi:hypothetical protein